MILRFGLISLSALTIAVPAIAQSYAPYQSATLRTLDKITGRSTDIEINLDEPIVFGSLTVAMRACFRTPPEEPPESAAFLQIYGQQARAEGDEVATEQIAETIEETKPLFSGWMFASSPGLSALEHPVYDVWVIRCNAPFPSNDDGVIDPEFPIDETVDPDPVSEDPPSDDN